MSADVLVVTSGGGGDSGWRPGILLSILQSARQLPTTHSYTASNANGAEVKNPCNRFSLRQP